MVKVRCPVCKGWGIVEAEFASGESGKDVKSGCNKQCPACKGTGMQEISDPIPTWYYYQYQPYQPQPYQPYPWNPTPTWYGTGTATQQSNYTYTIQYGCGGSCSCSKPE